MNFVDFEQVAKDLNTGCKGTMLNRFENGYAPTEWTKNCVQIGVSWCYVDTTNKKMCANCQNVFMKLYIQMVKNFHICQQCEKEIVIHLCNNGFKYQNEKVISDLIKQHQCNTCAKR